MIDLWNIVWSKRLTGYSNAEFKKYIFVSDLNMLLPVVSAQLHHGPKLLCLLLSYLGDGIFHEGEPKKWIYKCRVCHPVLLLLVVITRIMILIIAVGV